MKAIAEKQKKVSEKTEYDALAWRKDMLEYKKRWSKKCCSVTTRRQWKHLQIRQT